MIETSATTEHVTIEAALDAHIHDLEFRKRKPAKLSTLATFRSYRHWVARVAQTRVIDFNNATMRDFIAYLSSEGLSPKTVSEVSGLVKSAIASLVDPNTGESQFLRKWNHKFLDAPEVRNQRQPTVTASELEDAIAGAFQADHKLDGILWALAAGSGARVGELRSLRIGPNESFSYWSPDDSSLAIRTSVWRNIEQTPKTEAAHRTIEIAESLNNLLKDFVASRTAECGDFLFANTVGKPADVSTLRRHLDYRLPGKGFHALRRWRVTFLRSKQVPEDLIRAWLGHSPGASVTNRYSKLAEDVGIRKDWCRNIGLGFTLPG